MMTTVTIEYDSSNPTVKKLVNGLFSMGIIKMAKNEVTKSSKLKVRPNEISKEELHEILELTSKEQMGRVSKYI